MKTNPYLNINRIEFMVTFQCPGKCKHCSVGSHINEKGWNCVNSDKSIEAIEKVARRFSIESLMTFGGEPLLYSDTTCALHHTARQCKIPNRQVITCGYFSKDPETIQHTAQKIHQAGINDILLSVDTFHQETIPIDKVRIFAETIVHLDAACIHLHPAWVIRADHQNSYNEKTRQIVDSFSDIGIDITYGNDIFPAGNAAIHLQDFYKRPEQIDLSAKCGELLYTEKLDDVRALSIEPNGDVVVCVFPIGNIYKEDMDTILDNYNPYQNELMSALMDGGVETMLHYCVQQGKTIDTSDCYSSCSVCRKVLSAFQQ